MRHILAAAPLVVASACSTLVPGAGTHLVCQRVTDPCPTDDDLFNDVAAFAGWVPGFDATEDLTVVFADHGKIWDLPDGQGGTIHAVGFTASPNLVYTTSFDVLTHELMHVQFWRTTGDGDANHAEPPGPWTWFTDSSVHEFNNFMQWGGQ